MQITFFTTSDDKAAVPKTLTEIGTYTGAFRSDVDVLDPVFDVTSNVPLTCNYLYIPRFSRYYFCRVETIRTGLYRLHCHVDVLQSWFEQIKTCPAMISRAENSWNSYIADAERRFYQFVDNTYLTIGDVGAPTAQIMVTVG